MLPEPLSRPRRVLMTLDAVGGVWRYVLDVACGLEDYGVSCLLVGFGPEPNGAQWAEYGCLANAEMVWTNEPLDWMVSNRAELDPGVETLAALAEDWDADLLHLNLPSQASGLRDDLPVVVASHSCVPTWWEAVHGTALPAAWAWQHERNREGLRRAQAILVPSASHGAAVRRTYGPLPPLHVVHNATSVAPLGRPDTSRPVRGPVSGLDLTQGRLPGSLGDLARIAVSASCGCHREALILAVGRWWDAGKNGEALDAAAVSTPWPIALAGPLCGPNGACADFHNVHVTGLLSHPDILALMRRAAIFAAPSRYEPFGLSVAEAAVSGAALVLSDIPTFRELWDDAALFVHLDDVDGWGKAFAMLAGDETLRWRLAAQAASRASQFTPRRQAARLFQLYSSVGAAAVT